MVVLKIYALEDTEERDVLVSLKEGEHVIGRGGILPCTDKRISRQHALLQVTKEFITIKSVHINPCFFKGADDSSVSIITQNTLVVLNDGDRFALLADKFWFKVRIADDENNRVINGDVGQSNETHLSNGNESSNGSPSRSVTTNLNTSLTNGCSSKRGLNQEDLTESCKRQKADHQEHIDGMSDKGNTSLERTPSRPSSPGLDVLLDTSPNVTTSRENIDSIGLINSLENIVREDFGNGNGDMENKDEDSGRNPEETESKESTNSNGEAQVDQEKPDENVQVKQEPEDNVENQQTKPNSAADVIPPDAIKTEIKEENAGGSKDNEGDKDNASKDETGNASKDETGNASKDETDKASSSTNSQNKKSRRERCWFGATCYRKNPIHRADLSHPGDNDYDSDPDDDRPRCPYGAACYRKNIEHRRQYKHLGRPVPKASKVNVHLNLSGACPYCPHCIDKISGKPDYESDYESDYEF